MLERTDAITNEVLEPITFVLAYPTLLPTVLRKHGLTSEIHNPNLRCNNHRCITFVLAYPTALWYLKFRLRMYTHQVEMHPFCTKR